MQEALLKHLKTGATTVCRAWLVQRTDGVNLGFTDHDDDLTFDGNFYSAETGLTAQNIEKNLGMSIDNTEVIGALSDASINENDIMAGRYDGAEVVEYLVNWKNVEERSILFRGTFGDLSRKQGAFRVELRGLSAALNIQRGRIYHPECSAALGDSECKVDLSNSGFTTTVDLIKAEGCRFLYVPQLPEFSDNWFRHGQVKIKNGVGYGQIGRIRSDIRLEGYRKIELWQGIGQLPKAGDEIELVAGCDKRASICRTKFDNFLNFRGFPHIPGEDWLRAGPNFTNRR